MLQLIDDCRDVLNQSQDITDWEISLPLLLYMLATGEEHIRFPKVGSRAELSDLLGRMDIINTIASLLLEWKNRALESLKPLSIFQGKTSFGNYPRSLPGANPFIFQRGAGWKFLLSGVIQRSLLC